LACLSSAGRYTALRAHIALNTVSMSGLIIWWSQP